jgi:hypothetical protein
MAGTLGRQVPLLRFRNVLAQVVRRLRLATARNVVELALDREQSDRPTIFRFHKLSTHAPFPVWKQVLL